MKLSPQHRICSAAGWLFTEHSCPLRNPSQFSRFETGNICWSPNTGAHGAILFRWVAATNFIVTA
ncbi:hypothetical protein [Rhodococcoides yunnanense]|uniref:hypothetical protein n=1 Tax=Rhodococcoides yunnanense TaxID=278209 RepID=UPI0035300E0F